MPRDRTGEWVDQLLEAEPPEEDVGCSVRCDHGWIAVLPGYAAREHPHLSAEQQAHIDANTVYPCKRCNFEAFSRWHRGHFAPNHSCAECAEVRRHHGGGRKDAA